MANEQKMSLNTLEDNTQIGSYATFDDKVDQDKNHLIGTTQSSNPKKVDRFSIGESTKKLKEQSDNLVLTKKRDRKQISYSAMLAEFDEQFDKKPRGRPKKVVVEMPGPKVAPSSIGRKRGRPKKVVTASEQDTSIAMPLNKNNLEINKERQLSTKISEENVDTTFSIRNNSMNEKKKNEQNGQVSLKIQEEPLSINLEENEDTSHHSSISESNSRISKNKNKRNTSVLKKTYLQSSDSESSESLGIKSVGRPKKRKRGRPKKTLMSPKKKRPRVLSSDDESNGSCFDSKSDQDYTDETEDAANASEEDVKISKGRKRGSVYYRTNLDEKPYKQCTTMYKKVLEQCGTVENNGAELLDAENSENVKCGICKESISNKQWNRHKRKVHYNLAWHLGEFAIDVHDESVIFGALKEIRDTYDQLNCHKCGWMSTRIKDFWQHVEKCSEIVSPTGMVTCAVCSETLLKTEWNTHRYKKHNNLAWRVNEPPIDLTDQAIIVHILNKIYKERKPLTCEKCGKVIKSVLGFLSHKSKCQKSVEEIQNLKVQCPMCPKKIFPVSMDWHLKAHREREANESIVLGIPEISRRRAADRAREIIHQFADCDSTSNNKPPKQRFFGPDDMNVNVKYRYSKMRIENFKCIFPDCNYEYSTIHECLDHLRWCEKRPLEFVACKLCLKICTDENSFSNHFKEIHKKLSSGGNDDQNGKKEDGPTNDADDVDFQVSDEADSEGEVYITTGDIIRCRKRELTSREKTCISNNQNFVVKPDFLIERYFTKEVIYSNAYEWMLEFCHENYGITNLFPNLTNQTAWSLLSSDILDAYFPKASYSCDVACKRWTSEKEKFDNDAVKFRKLELFEAVQLHEEDVTIFCGGPISALAWLPTLFDKQTQILAVATLNDMESRYLIECNYYEPYLIQLWDYGVLENRQEELQTPSLMYSIAVNFGPIWHLEWCPSGCFSLTDSDNRLGLLAVAASDSFVYIFAVDKVPEDQRGLVLKGKHCLKLQLCDSVAEYNSDTYYATKISWTKASGHKYIAVGYSNGYVALFNLMETEESFLSCNSVTNEKVLFPYLKFQPQVSAIITALSLSHLDGGNTYLLTGTSERDVSYWDLRSLTCISTAKNSNPSDGVWMTQWISSTFSEDRGASKNGPVSTTVWSPRQFMTEKYFMTYSLAPVKCLSFSDWLNIFVHGSYMGEIMGNISNQLARLISYSYKSKGIKNCLFSRADLVMKNKESVKDLDNITSYHDTAATYGLVFTDYNLSDLSFPQDFMKAKKMVNPDLLKDTSIEPYPFQAINKIVFNPNPQACTFLVAGYQSGLIRLKPLKFTTQLFNRL